MEIYICTILMLSIFALFEVNYFGYNISRIKKYLAIFSFAVVVLQLGLRWEMGTDWEPYYDHYLGINRVKDFKYFPQYDTGYQLTVLFVKKLFNSYSTYLILNSALFYFLIFKFYSNSTPYFFIAILLMYVSFIGLWGANRQLIALGFVLLSIYFLFKKNYRFYGLAIIIAFLFHSSSLFALIYFFFNRRFTTPYIFIFLGICFLIGRTSLPMTLFSSFGNLSDLARDKAEAYRLNSEVMGAAGYSMVGVIKRILFFGLFLYGRQKIAQKYPQYNLYFNGYVFGLGVYLFFTDTLSVMTSRGSLYFNIMEPLLLSFQALYIKNKVISTIVIVFLAILGFMMFKQSISIYPEAFIPYKWGFH